MNEPSARAVLRAETGEPPYAPPGGWWSFEHPVEVLDAPRPEQVPPLLRRLERAAGEGLWAVGFVAYEAAPAFDTAFCTHVGRKDVPAARFGLFEEPAVVADPAKSRWPGESTAALSAAADPVVRDLRPTVTDAEYLEAVARVRSLIARGETYQANLTYRLRGVLESVGTGSTASGAGRALLGKLAGDPPAPYAACLDLGHPPGGARGGVVCSASPELFFQRSGGRLVCRPMKGTAARGRTAAADRAAAEALRSSPKERAENLMIVDMVRNDLGRVARAGSVQVPELFRVERYPTVLQMTSEVTAASDAPLEEVFGALFPCASITGAPKVRTMEILTELETTPRGVYTGAIGLVAPGGRARFSVAIRTAWLGVADRGDAGDCLPIEYGTGGGVVWDSDPERELAETRTKALILVQNAPPEGAAEAAPGHPAPPAVRRSDFRLLETLAWRAGEGFTLLERHLARLASSAEFFGFVVDPEVIRCRLLEAARELEAEGAGDVRKARLLVDRCGRAEIQVETIEPGGIVPEGSAGWLVSLADAPVDERDPFLFHKTTRRGVYDRARSRVSGVDDVILWNRAGELTESTVANLVVERAGQLVTPPVACGLLPGTLRAELLERGAIREARLVRTDLERASRIWLINSVRGWIPITEVRSGRGVSYRHRGNR